MERLTLKEHREAAEIALAEGDFSFDRYASTPLEAAMVWVSTAERLAARLHALYEGQCSVDLGTSGNRRRDLDAKREEVRLRAHFAKAGLGLYLNGDPRGNPVGILTPKTGRYNTMGGRECGWRL